MRPNIAYLDISVTAYFNEDGSVSDLSIDGGHTSPLVETDDGNDYDNSKPEGLPLVLEAAAAIDRFLDNATIVKKA